MIMCKGCSKELHNPKEYKTYINGVKEEVIVCNKCSRDMFKAFKQRIKDIKGEYKP